MSLRSASNSRAQPGRHLMAQFLAQALQLAGDLADGGDAVLLAAHAVEVARQRLIGAVAVPVARCGTAPRRVSNAGSARRGGCVPAARAVDCARRDRVAIARQACADGRRSSCRHCGRCAVRSVSSERLSCSIELCARRCRPAFKCVEIGPFAVHRNARLSIAAGPRQLAPNSTAGNGRRLAKSLRRKASSGALFTPVRKP